MDHKERMLQGLPYKAWMDGLSEERAICREKIFEINHLHPKEWTRLPDLLKNLFGSTGKDLQVNPPFFCDYGYNIHVGENFYANYNLTILDVGKVTIGKNVMFAPHVSIYTAGHPLHPEMRNTGYEYGIEVTIGDNVWVGGNVVILPGVTIGDNVVIGSGSVVTKDLPDNALAAGNPCRVLRFITEEDRKYYYRDRTFDEDSLKDLGLEL